MGETDLARAVIETVVAQSRRVLASYKADPGLIEEHANNERRIAQGGYGDRQIFELVQNAADELREDPGGEIAVVLTTSHLYCANQGSPVTPDGADTILRMSVSRKRGGQIGRFGVGVKSVLAISDTPQFFSRANGVEFGFRFDREWSAERIRAVYADARETPVLRMAEPLDVSKSRAVDPVLNELLKWATTVVRLPLKPSSVNRLGRDITAFPVAFPLFSPHIGTVTLDDRRGREPSTRQILQRVDGDRRIIQETKPNGDDIAYLWRVFTRRHAPSPEALRAAGELHDRPEVEISWAVPQRSGARGEFWAFFPTKFQTTLRGILNAPWKTSEDRQAIYDGNEFNEELIRVGAELVVESLPMLSREDDPTVYIDYLPGRGREAPQFVDERLTDAIWDRAAEEPSLADQRGVLRRPAEMHLHPDGLREEWLKLWAGLEDRPINWVHPSAEKRERRARVSLILNRAGRSEAGVREWLEALAEVGAEGSGTAVRIAAGMVEAKHPLVEEALRSRIVLTESKGLVAPVRGEVFRRATVDDLQDDIAYVAEEVVAGFGVTAALETIGVREADAAGRFAAVVDQGFHGYTDSRWTAFWELSRSIGSARAFETLRSQSSGVREMIRVRTVAGDFRLLRDCLAPGPVVPSDGSRDAHIAVDLEFHLDDRHVLFRLGLLEGPKTDTDPRAEAWFADYHQYAWDRHVKALDDKAPRPNLTTVQVDGPNHAGPLHFLRELSDVGRAAFLERLPVGGLVGTWNMHVGRNRNARASLPSPLVWLARTEGVVQTSRGLRRLRDAVGPALDRHRDVLPVAKIPQATADTLRLPTVLGKVPRPLWLALIEEAAATETDEFAGRVYTLAIEASAPWPEGVGTRCRVGTSWTSEVPDSEIAVTADRAEYDMLIRESVPALLAPTPEAAALLVETWGMLEPSQVIEKEIQFASDAEPVPLLDLFPHLRLRRADLGSWSVTRCSRIEEVTRTPHGLRTTPVPHAVMESTVLVPGNDDDFDTLLAVDAALGLKLGSSGCRSILEQRRRQQESERRRAVRQASTPEKKLLELVGESALRAGLPQGLEDVHTAQHGTAPTGDHVARLAIDTFGSGVLRHYGKDVAAHNPDAPRSFSGNTSSRRFVTELGLPEEYAGASVVSPPEMEEVAGPSEYPRLHDYQERVTENMVRLLTAPSPQRALLRLPTGAGKTRVAVEAVIRRVRRGPLVGPILWIAQSEELCEQAVETWKFVWSKVGPGERLTVNRFWSGNDAAEVTANTQLVVATDAKLATNLHESGYAWLRRPALVIVDEAHRAVSPRYTALLEQLGLTRSRTDRPMVGLTATPFRSNEDETKWLINRFGGRRLDEGLFADDDPYTALQELGVLARVQHRQLDGATLTLDVDDSAAYEQMAFLPAWAEERLAGDADRNDTIVDEIARLDPEWPVLVFAASVRHSLLLTAMLNGRGIRSESIDSYTPIAERRRKIDNFRRRSVRVITNYGVLAQGFDAPATRVVIIARPTYSPNVYQQMIGRGLRGPLNGGKETCLILDVRDNIQNFGRALAFTGFEHLWQTST